MVYFKAYNGKKKNLSQFKLRSNLVSFKAYIGKKNVFEVKKKKKKAQHMVLKIVMYFHMLQRQLN